MPNDTRLSKILFVVFCVVAVALLGALAAIDPAKSPVDICLFHALTGWHCAGCGSTRALHALLNGSFMQAMAYNPLTTLASPFAAYLVVHWGLLAFFGKRLPLPRAGVKTLVLIAALTLAFTVARNIPEKPFAPLAPHELSAR